MKMPLNMSGIFFALNLGLDKEHSVGVSLLAIALCQAISLVID
jgi:hypothetical protein